MAPTSFSSTGQGADSNDDLNSSFETDDNGSGQRLSTEVDRRGALSNVKASSKLSPQAAGRKNIAAMFDATLDFSEDFENSKNSESNNDSFSNSSSSSFNKSPTNTAASRGSLFNEEGATTTTAAKGERGSRSTDCSDSKEAQHAKAKEKSNTYKEAEDDEDDIEEDIEEDIVEEFEEEEEEEEDNDQYSFDDFDSNSD